VSTFAQDNTGDFDLSSGNLVIRSDIPQVTAWKLTNLFSFFKGEWFRDSRLGIPYFQYVYVKNPNLALIGSIFEQVLRSPAGVASVPSVALDFEPRSRKLSATFQAVTNEGAVLTGGLGVPFIISVKP
jgi:hypothetical protein